MGVVAACFGPCAPDALPAYVSVFSHDFTRCDRFATRAPSASVDHACLVSRRRAPTLSCLPEPGEPRGLAEVPHGGS
jgi:hypothetical protein